MKIPAIREVLKHLYGIKPAGTGHDDMVDYCKFCGKAAWLRADIKHGRGCELARALKEADKVEAK